jgi:hypothetical protein
MSAPEHERGDRFDCLCTCSIDGMESGGPGIACIEESACHEDWLAEAATICADNCVTSWASPGEVCTAEVRFCDLGQCNGDDDISAASELSATSVRMLAVAPIDSIVELDPERSEVVVRISRPFPLPDLSTRASMSGRLHLTSPTCNDAGCTFQIDMLRVTATDFSIGGNSVTDTLLTNSRRIPAKVLSQLPGDPYVIAPADVRAVMSFRLNGDFGSFSFTPDAPVSGVADFEGGSFSLAASGSEDSVHVSVRVVGTFVNRPPTAIASAPHTVECDQPGAASVPLDARQSSDPDGFDDIKAFAWFSNYWTTSPSLLATGAEAEATLPMGHTDVTLMVLDNATARDLDELTVSVIDTTPPTITNVAASPPCLWPPNKKLVRFVLGDSLTVEAADICDPSPTMQIIAARQIGGTNLPGDPIDVFHDSTTVCLRSDRKGGELEGRAYEIDIEVTDESGNTSVARLVVRVPHDARDGRTCNLDPARLRLATDACAALEETAQTPP